MIFSRHINFIAYEAISAQSCFKGQTHPNGRTNYPLIRFFKIAEKVADIVETLSASKNMSAGYCMTKPGSYSDYIIP